MKMQLFLITTMLIFAISCNQSTSDTNNALQGELLEDTVVDVDGNVYHLVRIGTQVWMTENLVVVHYRNGDEIPNITDSAQWNRLTTGAYCNYNNDSTITKSCGRLYNWYTVQDTRDIAPKGWHVPSREEWNTLADYLGGTEVAGGKLKSLTGGWEIPNEGADNTSGFSGLPCGLRNDNGIFKDWGLSAYLWSSSEKDTRHASGRGLFNSFKDFGPTFDAKRSGWSVRCIKD